MHDHISQKVYKREPEIAKELVRHLLPHLRERTMNPPPPKVPPTIDFEETIQYGA